MDDISLEPASKADLAEAAHWAGLDSPGSLLFKTHGRAAAEQHGGALRWAARQNNQLVGVVSMSVDEDRIGHLDMIVKPDERRQGIGTSMLEKTLLLPEVKETSWLRFTTKHGNVAAKGVLRENGFHERFVSEEGGLVFERRT